MRLEGCTTPCSASGGNALDVALAQIEGEREPQSVRLRSRLVRRDSTGPVAAAENSERAAPEAAGQFAMRLVQMLAAAEAADATADEITLQFDQGLVTLFTKLGLMLETKYGVEEVPLGVLTTPKANQAKPRPLQRRIRRVNYG